MYTWNEPGTGISNISPSYSDFRFLDKFISDVQSRVNIDGAKIGGAGFSEGGMVLQKYATERPRLFSALGSIHGTINGTEAVPLDATGRPIPQNVVIVHSETDHMLPYKGGRGFMTAFLPQVKESKPYAQAEFWAKVNQTEAPAVKSSTPVYDRTNWIAKDGQHAVTEYVIKGGQHAIEGSPAPGLALVGRPLSADKFDAPATVWKFITGGAKIARSLSANVTTLAPARTAAA
jgi:poly(3-hydroxybutyrate) depolymerase